MGTLVEKITRAYKAANAQCQKDQQESSKAVKRYWNRMKSGRGLVGLGSEAAKSYKKDGSLRNAVKTATNTVIDNVADNTKDLCIIFSGMGARNSASVFVQEFLK